MYQILKAGLLLMAVTFFVPVGSLRAEGPTVLDMEAAVKMGLERNQSLQAVREQVKGREYGTKSARGAFGPSLSSSYGYTRLDERPESRVPTGDPQEPFRTRHGSRDRWELNINIHQPLFTGFNLLSTYEKSKLAHEQSKSQLSRAELELVLEIQTSFLDLLAARESVRVAEDSLTRLNSHLDVSRSFYDVGLVPRQHVLEAKVDVSEAEQELISARNRVDTLESRLNMLLGLPRNMEVVYEGRLEFVPFTLDLDESRDRALQNRPDIFIADKSIQMALQDERITASDMYPHVGATFDVFRRGDDPTVSGSAMEDRSEWRAGVQMQWTLFEWGRTYYAREQARQETRQLVAEYEDLLQNVSFEVKSDYLLIQESRQRIKVARQGLEEAKESYRMAQARYEAQVGTSTQVLDAQANLTAAEARLINAESDFLKAVASIYRAMGEKNISLRAN
ncbi:TolC family protein [Desulfonatronospira thiodismutans]|nr:TolC family protein [Desulfonatronospira thiodismutans]